MFPNRLVAWLSGLSLLILFELALTWPKNLYWFVGLSLLLLFFSVWRLAGRLTKAKFWNFLITPLIFLSSAWLFIIFLEDHGVRQLTILISVILYFVFLKVVFLYLYRRPKYEAHTLGNISSYIGLVAIFFLTAGVFSLRIFLSFSYLLLALPIFILTALLVYQLFWASQAPIASSLPHVLVIAIVVTEIFAVVNFLPTSVYVSGLIVTVVYYLLSGLSRNWLLNIRESRVVVRYLTISFISLMLILLSAKWI